MLSVLKTTLLSWLSKGKVLLIAAGALLLSVSLIAAKLFTAGRKHERLQQAERTITQYKKEVQIDATIRSLGADVARERLRAKWRKR